MPWDIDVLKRLGAPVTKQNRRFLQTWQRWEGGHTNNTASFNWLNTTRGSQYPSMNTVGVRVFPDYRTGIDYTAQTIMSGYQDVVAALRQGNPYKYSGDIRGDLSKWVSGSRTARPDYAAKILGESGPSTVRKAATTAVAAVAGAVPLPAKPSPGVDNPFKSFTRSSSLFKRSKQDSPGVPDLVGDSLLDALPTGKLADGDNGPVNPKLPKKRELQSTYNGKVYVPGTSWKGSHVTDGLDWNNGQKTAQDIMLAPGTPIGAPEDGEIVRWGSAQGGEALYFRGKSGRMYWMGHIDDRLPVGSKVRRGQQIATVSADHAAPHLHIDRKM